MQMYYSPKWKAEVILCPPMVRRADEPKAFSSQNQESTWIYIYIYFCKYFLFNFIVFTISLYSTCLSALSISQKYVFTLESMKKHKNTSTLENTVAHNPKSKTRLREKVSHTTRKYCFQFSLEYKPCWSTARITFVCTLGNCSRAKNCLEFLSLCMHAQN